VSNEATIRRKVLLTGAAGRIGTAFLQQAGERYTMRLVDGKEGSLADSTHEALTFDMADLDACQRACVGIDTVIHLAADPSAKADFYGSLLDNNIKATYNIFRAAKDQNCARVIYASSIQAMEAYPLDVQISTNMPVRPISMYGVSKCFGEAVASYFAHVEGLSSIVVRIGTFTRLAPGDDITARTMSTFVSPRDLVHLLVQCIETPDVQFGIVHGVSNNRFKRMDPTPARELVGYEPQDDSFKILGFSLRDNRPIS
jgi:nucleoside-diphosphate-sugar epimerase